MRFLRELPRARGGISKGKCLVENVELAGIGISEIIAAAAAAAAVESDDKKG